MKMLSIAAATIALIATPAMAETTSFGGREAVTIRVSASGLNLANPRDQQRLRQRVSRAIAAACTPGDRMYDSYTRDEQCLQEMGASASASPLLRNLAQNDGASVVGQN
ncbi:MAG: UrcA family protein [Rhizorhabdus sp.]